MSFLQPMILAALPLVALPIIIHLINQRRYQTVRWAAMMFLLAANRMSRGYARLRQWLVMAFRMAAIAALIFAVSRPLAGGWLGLTAGGRADTTLVLLDRSPSMRQGGTSGTGSKLETGRAQLARALKTFGTSRWVLIDGATRKPREMASAEALLRSTFAAPADAPSDLPAMLEAARDYIKTNKPGRAEIWICSDVRRNDWDPESARWRALRESFLESPQGVRFHLLAYPKAAPANLSVRVTDVRLKPSADGAELLLSVRLTREGGTGPRQTVPVQFEINGARSEVAVEVNGSTSELRDHRVALGRGLERGQGRVSIPADANPADNDFYFAFDRPVARRAAIVADDPRAARPLQLAASIAPDPSLRCSAEIVAADHLAGVDWDALALLLWQGPLPSGDSARLVRSFLDRGGRAIFFPGHPAGDSTFLGLRWTSWTEGPEAIPVETWRGDQDLLAKTQSGLALPVGQLEVRNHCGLLGEFTPLATLRGGSPLVARAATGAGGAYFCATTPAPADSNLATGGIVLYALVQRALASGAQTLEGARQVAAGDPVGSGDDPTRWRRLAGADNAISTEYSLHRGVYASTRADRLIAVNRPAAEDAAPVLADAQVAGLFKGLDFARVDDEEGNLGPLIQEVWRLLLAGMMTAMVVEAWLCLPSRRPGASA